MFIVYNCTIFLIVRTVVNISVLCQEMAFYKFACTEKRFGIFIEGELWGFVMPCTQIHLVISISSTTGAVFYRIQTQPLKKVFKKISFFSFVKLYNRVPEKQLYKNVSFLY